MIVDIGVFPPLCHRRCSSILDAAGIALPYGGRRMAAATGKARQVAADGVEWK
jgi:hypothetical protein